MGIRLRSAARRGSARAWIIGCLSAFGVFLILVVVAVILIVRSAKSIAASAVQGVMTAQVNASQLPADQKQRINVQLERLSTAFKDGRNTMDDLGRVAKEMSEGPLMPIAMIAFVREKYIKPSALSAEEKAGAERDFQRFMRGLYEKKIPSTATGDLMKLLMVQDAQGRQRLKETLTPAELAAVIAFVKGKADAAGVPDEPFEVDIAGEITKAVDKVLGKQPAEAPAAGGT
jgi:hypothetical protein